MTRDETIKILLTIQAAYPNFNVPDKTITVNTWHSLLGSYDYMKVVSAVEAYVRSNKSGFAPSIGQIIDKICVLFSDEEDNELDAWSKVQKAIRNSTYHSEEEFQKLPELVKKIVGSPVQLREWAIMENADGKTWSVMQSNFIRTYRAKVEQEKEIRKLSPEIMKIIKDQRENSITTNKSKEIGHNCN